MKKYIHFLLIYFVIFSFNIIVNTYSKYNNNLLINKSIAIAKWNIEASLPNETLDLVSGSNIEDYIINISYKSEVASNYIIKLTNVPDEIEVSLNNNSYISSNNNQIIIDVRTINSSKEILNIQDTLHFKSTLATPNLLNHPIQIEVIFNQVNL